MVDETICGKCKEKLVGTSVISPNIKEDLRYLCTKCALQSLQKELSDEDLKKLDEMKKRIEMGQISEVNKDV